MGNMFENVLLSASEREPKPKSEYIGEDGLLHCSACHKATQTGIELLGKKRTVRCICQCEVDRMQAEEDRRKREAHERVRRRCFDTAEMAGWNFSHDDRQNPKISDAMKRYVDQYPDFMRQGKGLLLYGTVGTGKTYYAACVANALIDRGYTVRMTNFATLGNQLQGLFEGKQDFIDRLNRHDLLVIDDLGAERSTEYMLETVFNIIDSRYRTGLPLIVTTNLTPEELKSPKNVSYGRIYDRVMEMCFPIEVRGNSRRRAALKDTFADTKERLGLG